MLKCQTLLEETRPLSQQLEPPGGLPRRQHAGQSPGALDGARAPSGRGSGHELLSPRAARRPQQWEAAGLGAIQGAGSPPGSPLGENSCQPYMTTWTHKPSPQGPPEVEERARGSIQPFRAAGARTGAACGSELPCLCPCRPFSLECPSRTSSWGKKTSKSANIVSSVKCPMLPRPNTAIPFSSVPEPVPGLSGPRSCTALLLLCKAGVTSEGCNSPSLKPAHFHWTQPVRGTGRRLEAGEGRNGLSFPFLLHPGQPLGL